MNTSLPRFAPSLQKRGAAPMAWQRLINDACLVGSDAPKLDLLLQSYAGI